MGFKTLCDSREKTIREIVELYKEIREKEFISRDNSTQMEYVLYKDTVYFLQERFFRKFEKALKFEIPLDIDEYSHFKGIFGTRGLNFTFGITPEEGIEMPFNRGWNPKLINNKACYALNNTYYYNNNGNLKEDVLLRRTSLPLYVQPNIEAYIPDIDIIFFLEHGVTRWLTKAKIGMLIPDFNSKLSGYDAGMPRLPEKVRVYSNGTEGAIEFLE